MQIALPSLALCWLQTGDLSGQPIVSQSTKLHTTQHQSSMMQRVWLLAPDAEYAYSSTVSNNAVANQQKTTQSRVTPNA